jgi:phospholipid transport system substrate-binding protein
MKNFRLISAVLLSLTLLSARAERPIDRVKATADTVLGILNNSGLQGDPKRAERRGLIQAELDRRFDWQGIAKTSLGRHWGKLQPADQKEFVAVFSRFLSESYVDKFEPYYKDLDRIDYKGELVIENYASVKTLVTTKQQIQHPVEYRLLKAAGDADWRVYDVLIEGVSMVNNYRVQFDEIIAKSSFEKLMADLRSKLPANPR